MREGDMVTVKVSQILHSPYPRAEPRWVAAPLGTVGLIEEVRHGMKDMQNGTGYRVHFKLPVRIGETTTQTMWFEEDEISAVHTRAELEAELVPFFKLVLDERCKQERIWGGDAHDDEHDEFVWVGILTHELSDALFHNDNHSRFENQMIKIAAVAQAAYAWVGRERNRKENA